MNDEERKTMITIGKAVTDLAKVVKEMQDGKPSTAQEARVSEFYSAPRTSVVDHEGTLNRFKMELKFEGGEQMAEAQRMDHSIRLLTEMEDLLREYGVTRLNGTYERTAKSVQA